MGRENWDIRFFAPALLICLGIGQYVFNKYISPISKEAIRDMNAHSLSGQEGDRHDPNWGLWVAGVGVLMFIVVNGVLYLRGF